MNSLDEITMNYELMYAKYGHSPEALCMPSDRRNIRYYDLLKNFGIGFERRMNGFSIIDFGCGFGDVNSFLSELGYNDYEYTGIDIVDSFLAEANNSYGNNRIRFLKRNFWNEDATSDLKADIAISSQTLNNRYGDEDNNYTLLFKLMKTMYQRVKVGFSINFFTDKVSFKKADTAYHNPATVLDFAYGLSKCIILDNSTFPYECTLTLIKEDSCTKYKNVYDLFCKRNMTYFDRGIFVVKEK